MKRMVLLLVGFCFTTLSWTQDAVSTRSTTADFANLTKKGNKVFIETMDKAVLMHASNKINFWGYWTVTSVREEASFVLRFNAINMKRGDKTGKAVFINPKTGETIGETNVILTDIKKDLNTKRQIIYRLIDEEIIPMVTNK